MVFVLNWHGIKNQPNKCNSSVSNGFLFWKLSKNNNKLFQSQLQSTAVYNTNMNIQIIHIFFSITNWESLKISSEAKSKKEWNKFRYTHQYGSVYCIGIVYWLYLSAYVDHIIIYEYYFNDISLIAVHCLLITHIEYSLVYAYKFIFHHWMNMYFIDFYIINKMSRIVANKLA